MGDRQGEDMENEAGLVNGNAEHCPTDMDIDDRFQPAYSLTATQVQDMKVLLGTLSMLSRSVQVPNRLFGKVTSIALRSDSHSGAHENNGSSGRENGIELEVPLHVHQPASLQFEVPETVASVLENGDTPKAHSSELNAELRVEDTSILEGCKGTTLAISEDRLIDNESISQPEPSEKSLVLNEGLQSSKSKEDDGQDRSDVSPQGPENSEQITLEEKEPAIEEDVDSSYVPGLLLAELDDTVLKKRLMTSAELRKEEGSRMESKLASRIREIKDLPAFTEEKVRQMNLIEQYSLDLLSLQKKVRAEVLQELRLKELCVEPDSRIYDWGLMRIRRSGTSYLGYGDTGHVMAPEADERQRRKREAERQRRLEEEEKTRESTRKRKFFNELLNMTREYQLQSQAAIKRRKQRSDGVQAWHGKQRQRATRAEKLRFLALKSDDQEAYMRMVEESKNERLTTLLSRTDDLLQRLGAMVQKQKDAEPEDAFILKKDKVRSHPKDAARDLLDNDSVDPEVGSKKRDLLEGQRQYNSAVHSIEEKVTVQPKMLQGGQLREYQIEGLQWMLSLYNNNLNGILADEMGLGKTIQTIALLAYLLENKGVVGPHIIIAPKAVLPNWAHELALWAPSIGTVLYDGRAEERRLLREEYGGEGKFNVLVTHYDLIMRDKAFLKKIKWNYMIVDEGHRLKNHDCMLSRTLTSGYHIRRRLLLTGTPIQNSLQELWSLLNFLLPAIFNSSENFEDWFNAPFTDRSDVSLTEEEQLLVIRRLHQVIRPFLLRRKKAEVEKFLPGKTQVILKCDMSAWQRLYYKQIMESGRVGLDIGTGKSRGLLNTAMQLRKCCNHPYLFLEGRDYDPQNRDELIRSSGKFELLDRLLPKLAKTGHRVLLFSQMTRLMDILEDYLEWHGYKFLRLDGTTKTEERGTLLQKFNAPESPYFMFLLSTRAGGLGLNLQTADTVILFDSDWNPQMDQQAEDRAHRIGQKKEVRVFVLVSVGSIEEEILERAKSKMGIDAKVIQAGLFNTTSTAQERREMLEEIMKRGSDVIGTDVPSEREINRLSARGDDEFDIFEEMDEERRQKEEYRSRLLEEHEVPEWVFMNDPKGEGEDGDQENDTREGKQVTGKRVRKEVMYTDVLSDSQWMKAIEDGADVGAAVKVQLTKRSKRREQQQAALEQEVAEMLEVDENVDDETLNNSNDDDADADADADDEILSDERLMTTRTTKAEHTELRYEEAEVKTTETRTRIVIKRRQQVEEINQVKEGSENRLRFVLRGDKAAANWKGLQRKRSRHGAAIPEEESPPIQVRDQNRDHEDDTEDDDESI